ncbi:MAG: DNA repair protein RecN [Micrococcaceae bacterium]
MLEYLTISSLGVIGQAHVEFDPGFTVVTGETGAGKTMVVTALNLLTGARADAGAIRRGADRASVEAGLVLAADHPALETTEEAGGVVDREDGGTAQGTASVVITRSITENSGSTRSRATAGGRGVPVALLGELGAQAVAVHGQTDQLRLRSTAAQRHALDAFGGAELARALQDYAALYRQWREAQSLLAEISENQQDRAREADALQRALEEIDEAALSNGEDEEVRQRIQRLENVEELRGAALTARTGLSGSDDDLDAPSAEALVEAARQALLQAPEDEALVQAAQRLGEAGIVLADISAELAAYAAGLDDEGPTELDAAQSRLAELTRLMRLYGPEVSDVIAYAETHRPRLDELQGDTDRLDELAEGVQRLETDVVAQAATVSQLRRAAGERLAEHVTTELNALSMPSARFHVQVEPATEPGPHGADEVALLLQPHPGSDPRPLGKGASGGELSRVMLALEVVLAATDPVPTFVFDEVDAGVGGEAAVQIGQRLARLALHVQVIVVTHLPQVAAFADKHLRVVKDADPDAGFTTSDVTVLEGEDRVSELARMLAGHADSDAAREHARELLTRA